MVLAYNAIHPKNGLLFFVKLLIIIALSERGLASVPMLSRCCNAAANVCGGATSGQCRYSTLPEESPTDHVIANFTVTDNNPITFTVVGSADALVYLKMVRNTDKVSSLAVKGRIDFEALSNAILTVKIQFTDGVNSPQKTEYTLQITDINDNSPEFMDLPYRCTVDENVDKTNCTGIRIWDKDSEGTQPTITATGINFPTSMYKIIALGPAQFIAKGVVWRFNMEIQKKLDYEKERIFQIRLVSKDVANHNSSTDMVLYVNDKPDQPPVFMQQPYDRSMPENSPVGTPIVRIVAKDGDAGINNRISYTLLPNNTFNEFFNLNDTTGLLSVAKEIDRENAAVRRAFSFLELKIAASEINTISQPKNISQSIVAVHLTITDTNDYTPTFEASSYTGKLQENTQKDVTFTVSPEIICRDLDSVPNAKFNLTVMKDNLTSTIFYVTPKTAVQVATVRVRVKNPAALDFEKVQRLSFQIVAKDTASPFSSSTVDVTVNLTDANDNLPKFNQSLFVFKVPENSAYNTRVGQVQATDGDSGKFGTITYTLEGSSKFFINNQTGEIFVGVNGSADNTLLDRDSFGGASYAMNVKAQDGGNLAGYAQVQIHLTDKNDKIPIFLPTNVYYATLIENKTVFQRGLKVSASDQDAAPANNITYSIVAGNYGSHFAVHPASGVVRVTKAVDLEDMPSEMGTSNIFNLTVQAQDHGTPPLASNCTIIITVEDINDNSPNFTSPKYFVTINETTAPNTAVLQVNATDADRSGPVIYRIQVGAADKFAINGVTGMLKVEDRAKLQVTVYNITVIAIDRGSPPRSSTAVVSVNVTDVNNVAPTFNAEAVTKVIEENNEIGSQLFIYAATDKDTSANLVYTIMKDRMSAKFGNTPVAASVYINMFNITNKGAIIANGVLNREVVETIIMPIMVNDTNAQTATPVQTATTVITIIVSDANDEAPRFQFPNGTTSFSLKILESLTPPADTSLTVQAVDRDKNDIVSYSLSDPTGHFQINARTGVIRLIKHLDYETKKTISMRVFAVDTGSHQINASVTASVVDTNDNNPNFTVFHTPVLVSEGASVGHIITRVTAVDADSGQYGTVSYLLSNNAGGQFRINATSGEISLAKTLDRDAAGGASFRLGVEARDNAGGNFQGKASGLMEIKVTDINDNAPTFSRAAYNFTQLKENAGQNVKIDEIAAVDKDMGNNSKLTYSLVAPASGDTTALNLFQVSTSQDGSSYRAILRTKKALKNAVGCHSAVLVAKDAGIPQLNGTVRLTFCVLDVNDFTPIFVAPSHNASTTLPLPEMVVNKTLYRVIANDTDKGNNGQIRFRLSSSSGDHEKFYIDPVTGVLRNLKGLDREVKAQYQFQIIAYDLGIPSLSSSVTVKVTIVDVDDHEPKFPASHRVQAFTISENQPLDVIVKPGVKGHYIGNVSQAQDADTGSNAVICYFIVSAGYTDKFYLNKRTGGLYAIAVFDRETAGEFKITIKAVGQAKCDTNDYVWRSSSTTRRLLFLTNEIKFNASDPSLSQIKIKIGDVNDNPPKFDRKFFFDGVTKDSPPMTQIIDFKRFVTDKDAGNNSIHTYSIDGEIQITQPLKQQLEEKGLKNVLTVGSSSGILMTGNKIYFQENMKGYFRFIVRVSDIGASDTANVTVYLLNEAQRVVVVFRDSPANVGKITKPFADFMSQITKVTVNIDNIVTHKRADGQADSSMTDMYIHAYDPKTHRIIPASELIKILDAKWRSLRTLYNQYNVIRVKSNAPPAPTTSTLEILRVALIITACILGLLVLITCISLWTCRSMYRRKLKAATTVAFGGENGFAHSTPMPGTNRYTYEGSNPIWMAQAQYDNFAMKDDIPSDKDRDSLDENAIVNKPRSPDIFDEQELVLNLNAESDNEDGPQRPTSNDQSDLLDAALAIHDFQKGSSQQMLVPTMATAPPEYTPNGNLPATAI